jgi:hypothetical protein
MPIVVDSGYTEKPSFSVYKQVCAAMQHVPVQRHLAAAIACALLSPWGVLHVVYGNFRNRLREVFKVSLTPCYDTLNAA